jgi:peptidoglycan/LPS O-acetylase OafA/YrhL
MVAIGLLVSISDGEGRIMYEAVPSIPKLAEQQPEIASLAKTEWRALFDFSRRIPELDGLRGVAIGLVIILHCVTQGIVARPPQLLGYFYEATQLFWSGVDLFFVLSGFLIGGILLDARVSPKYFSTFYIRRACRILPIFIAFAILVGLAYRFLYQPIGEPLDILFANRMPWYTFLSFTQNVWLSIPRAGIPAAITAITWSLAVEEQFYLVLPFIIRYARLSILPYIYIAGIVLAPVLRLFIAYHFRSYILATYLLLPCRMDSLFLGTLCAYCLRDPRYWGWLAEHRITLWMAFFVLLAGMVVLNKTPSILTPLMLSVGYGWISLFYATALILVLTDPQSVLGRAMRFRWLAALGGIAYSVYLFHAAVVGICVLLITGHGWHLATWKDFGAMLLAIAITIAIGKLSWRYFEKPIVRWGHTWQYGASGAPDEA